jgi:hypothetical protein
VIIVSRLAATAEAIRAFRPLHLPNAPAGPDPRPPVSPPPHAPPAILFAVALPARPAGFASLIVEDFPALFAEFGGKRFTLLWCDSCDSFGAGDCHGRCDGAEGRKAKQGNLLRLLVRSTPWPIPGLLIGSGFGSIDKKHIGAIGRPFLPMEEW